MVCKSLEHQMSYFSGLNGSFDVLMLERGKKNRPGEKVRYRLYNGRKWAVFDK